MGLQPSGCAPWIAQGVSSTSPSVANSGKRLRHLRDQASSRHRGDHVAGQLPAELLRELVAHRLRALAVVRPQVHVHEAPPAAVRDLCAEAVHAIVVAAHSDEGGTEHGRARDLGRLEVLGHEDHGFEPGRRRSRRHRVREVARGRAAHGVHPELLRLGQRHRHQPVLEREGGMAGRVVLDPEVADAELGPQPRRAQERGEPGAAADRRLPVDGQELAVAPQVARPLRDRLARERPPHLVHVVDRFQARPAVLAGGHGVLAPRLSTGPAPETGHETHDNLPKNKKALGFRRGPVVRVAVAV